MIAGTYSLEELEAQFAGHDVPRKDRGVYCNEVADALIGLLDENIARKRMESRRNISSRMFQSNKSADKKAGKKKKRPPKKEDEEAGPSIQKISMQEIGEEIEAQEADLQQFKEEQEKEATEVAEERARHAAAYQVAFQLYSTAILMGTETEGQYTEIAKYVAKLGDPDLTIRQMAVENILNDSNIPLAYCAFHSAMHDKVIAAKVLQGFGKMGHFEVVPDLLGVVQESAGSKEATARGFATKSIGDIIRALNGKQKSLGTRKFYTLVKSEKFEKDLTKLLPIVRKDILDGQMRKYYYTPQCIAMLNLIATKLIELKQKNVKVGFVKMGMSTPISKQLKEFSKAIAPLCKKK
jgi:hypothetical protein